MPVYLATSHAYRSWSEANPRGYVQRDEGLQPPSEKLARWRAEHAMNDPAKFAKDLQSILHDVVVQIAAEKEVLLYATATTASHIHKLFGFKSPTCTCGADAEECWPSCPARKHAERIITRMKQKMGQQLALHANTKNRKWFSRGWDLTPVKVPRHFNYLLGTYLPDHELTQGGVFRRHR